MIYLRGLIGIVVLIGLAVLASRDRKNIPWRLVGAGFGLQLVFAILMLRTPIGFKIFEAVNDLIKNVLSFSDKGAEMLFGNLIKPMIEVPVDGEVLSIPMFAQFAFSVLPTIIFFSSMISVLYYLGVMQKVVQAFAWVMMKVLGTSGAETLSCSANIFVGQTEAPLLIKPYVETMTNSELLTVMTGGFATVAGGVMAAYVKMLSGHFPNIAGHLLSASIMSAPAAIYLSKIILPETDEPLTKGDVRVDLPKTDSNVIEAAANGAGQGLQLALNVGAMLLAFVALIHMIDALFIWIGGVVGFEKLSLQYLFGLIFWPIAWSLGIPAKDCGIIGALLGKRLVLNEFITYLDLANILNNPDITLSPKSILIVTYAMCGFANFSSIAIQIGGIGGIAPSRRSDLARLGLYGVLAGSLATFMSGTIAGMLAKETRLQTAEQQGYYQKADITTMELRDDFNKFASAQLGVPVQMIKERIDPDKPGAGYDKV